MRSICDFNLSTPRNRTQSSNECGIVINNTVTGKSDAKTRRRSSFPETLTYPDIQSVQGSPLTEYPPGQPPSQGIEYPVQSRDVILESPEFLEAKAQADFYKELAHTFSKILKSTNLKLIVNLIDQSGKIIVDAGSLCTLIGLIVNVPSDQIHIEYESSSAGEGCTTKINPICKIETIKINHIDFKLGYNEKYNILGDTFAVSLKKVFITSTF
jgi:hypothetical protein